MPRFRLPSVFFFVCWLGLIPTIGFAQDLGGPATISRTAVIRERLGFEMYSSRNFPPLEAQLQTIAGLGYRFIEFSPMAQDVLVMRPLMAANGLSSPTGHFDLTALRSDLPAALARAKEFGVQLMVVSWLPPDQRPADAAGWTALGTEVEGIARSVRDAGLTLGWHTHDFEFATLADGSKPIDRLFAAAPDLMWEPDIGWIVRAGEDPVAWAQKYKARIRAAHLKDVAPPGTMTEGGWADVGYGTVPWDKVLPILADTPSLAYLVEHDEPSDYVRFATRSRDSIAAWSRSD